MFKDIFQKYFVLDFKWILGAVVLSILFMLLIKGNISKKNTWVATILIFYSLLVLFYTVISRDMTHSFHHEFAPFWSYKKALTDSFYRVQIGLNILMFVPIGFLLSVITRYRTAMIGAVCFTCVIELLQLVTTVGLFEFDDIISNTVGAVIGCGCLWVVRRIMRRRKLV